MTTYYSKDHEWVLVHDDNHATIGITHYAQEQLGDIVFVELPGEGTHFNAHDTLTELESVKAVSDVYIPVAGTVVESNQDVVSDPSLINKDAENKGWFCKIKLDDPEQLSELMSQEEYKKLIA